MVLVKFKNKGAESNPAPLSNKIPKLYFYYFLINLPVYFLPLLSLANTK